MPKCPNCGKHLFLAGAEGPDGAKYCDENCQTKYALQPYVARLSDGDVRREILKIQSQGCPECGEPDPVEVWNSHSIWSAVLLTRWVNKQHFCCQRCARKHQWTGLLFSAVPGWWGFPWGIIMTPVQIARGVGALSTKIIRGQPSPVLVRRAELQLAAKLQTETRRRQRQLSTAANAPDAEPRPAGPARTAPGAAPAGRSRPARPHRAETVADREARLVDGDDVDDSEFV